MFSEFSRKVGTRTLVSFILTVAMFLVLVCVSYSWLVDSRIPNLKEDFFASSLASYFGGGTGAENDPYIVQNSRHLYYLAWLQNKGAFENEYTYFEVPEGTVLDMAGKLDGSGADDELLPSGAIPPIGTDEFPFKGEFQGNGCVISNLWVSTNENDWKEHPEGEWSFTGKSVGMFGAVGEGSIISNFKIDSIEVKTHISDTTVGII